MKRDFKRIQTDYNKFLITIRLEEDENTVLSALSYNPRQSLVDLLNVVVNDPSLVEYGAFKPFEIKIFNDNGKWKMISKINEEIDLA